jgi:hypothetical protein
MKGIFQFALLCAFLCNTGKADSYAQIIPTPTQLGYEETQIERPDGRTVYVYKMPSSNRVLRLTYGPALNLESIEDLSPGGRVFERQEFYSGHRVKEIFSPLHIRTEIRDTRLPKIDEPLLKITSSVWKNGELESSEYFLRKRTAQQEEPSCRSNSSDNAPFNSPFLPYTSAIKSTLDIIKTGSQIQAGTFKFDSVKVIGCDAYKPNGARGALQMFTEAMKTGLSCLSQLDEQSRLDALKMSALLTHSSRPFTIACGNPGQVLNRQCDRVPGRSTPLCYNLTVDSNAAAESFDTNNPYFPGFYLNMANNGSLVLKGIAFHETTHLLGYLHAEGIDRAYLSQLCCFDEHLHDEPVSPTDGARIKAMACDILKNSSSLDWKSEKYQRQFAELMSLDARANIAAESAWTSYSNSPNQDPAALLAMVTGINKLGSEYQPQAWLEEGNAALGIIFASATAIRTPGAIAKDFDPERYYPSNNPNLAKKRAFFSDYGSMIGDLAPMKAESVSKKWNSFQSKAKEICPTLNDGEREQLDEAARITFIQANGIGTKADPDYQIRGKWQHPCGQIR